MGTPRKLHARAWEKAAPAMLMMILAPTFTELLLGGTRLSRLIAFPPVLLMEILVWGGGVNYVYALWALVYEAVCPGRRDETWLDRPMAGILSILFVLGATMAWFAWTHIARVKTFRLAVYHPSRVELFAAIMVVGSLFVRGITYPPSFGRAWRPVGPAPSFCFSSCRRFRAGWRTPHGRSGTRGYRVQAGDQCGSVAAHGFARPQNVTHNPDEDHRREYAKIRDDRLW